MIDDAPHPRPRDAALADVRVPVAVGGELLLRIVEMNQPHAVKARRGIDFPKKVLEAGG